MTTTYATKKNLVKALRKLGATEPTNPLKGHNHERYFINDETYALLNALCPDSKHMTILYARRSRAGNVGYHGSDEYVISKALSSMIDANQQMVDEMTSEFNCHLAYCAYSSKY